jgi:hypothetical protein
VKWIYRIWSTRPRAPAHLSGTALFAVPAAWFFLWVERKAVALMQGRVGPPFMQPFFDFIKLLGKDHSSAQRNRRHDHEAAWPLHRRFASAAGAVGLLPVLPSSGGFQGDLILLLALLELPSMCIIAAGFSSRSIFGEIGSAREAVLSVAYNVVFLSRDCLDCRFSTHLQSPGTGATAGLAAALAWALLALLDLPARQAASQPLLAAQRRAGDLLRPHGRICRTRAGHVGTLARPRVGCRHRPGRHARRSATSPSGGWPAIVFVALSFAIGLDALHAGCLRHRKRSAIDTTVRFYWQVHAYLRGTGHLVRALHEV